MNKLNEWKANSEFSIAEVDIFPKEIYKSQIQKHLMGEYRARAIGDNEVRDLLLNKKE